MKHALTVLGCVVVAMAWLTQFVERVLDNLWPYAAMALAVVLLAGAGALAILFIGTALARVRPMTLMELPAARQTVIHQAASPAQPPTIDQAALALDNSRAFRQELSKFVTIGNSRGFSLRSMIGHVSRQAWELYVGLLVSAKVLSSDKAGTGWANGWTLRLFLERLSNGELALPYPNGRPPAVHWIKPGSTAQLHSTAQPTQAAH